MKKTLRRLLGRLRGEPNLEKLKRRGLQIGKNFKMMGEVIIDPSHCWHISIGDNVILAPRVHILAHDASTGLFLKYTKVANVNIGNNVFIGAGSIVLMGVTIGDNVVIGAGSIVSHNIPSNSVAVGNPAKVVCSLDEYLTREKQLMTPENTFGEKYTLRNPDFSNQDRRELLKACDQFRKIYVE